MKYQVVRDTLEKAGKGWLFEPEGDCIGTAQGNLIKGDYSLKGFENRFTIERKGSTAEFSHNLYEARFEDELCRMDLMDFPYLFLEFQLDDIYTFPVNSGVPRYLWEKLKMTPKLFLKRFLELQLNHPNIKIMFVGDKGPETAAALFKYISRR